MKTALSLITAAALLAAVPTARRMTKKRLVP